MIGIFKRLSLLLMGLALLFAGCGKEEPLAVATSIELSPSVVNLNDSEEGSLVLTPTPSGIGDWQLVSQPGWLTVSSIQGKLNGPSELTLMPVTTGLQPGTYTGEVEISSTAGFATAQVTLTVGANPKASLSSSTLHFPTETEQLTITVKNIGTGALNWQLNPSQTWFSTEPATGSLASGASANVLVKVSRKDQSVGTKEAVLTLKSNSVDGDMLVATTMEVPEIATIGASSENVVFNYFINKQEVTITNTGNVAYSWTASAQNSLFTVVPANGNLAVGASAVLTLTPNRTGLTTGDHASQLHLSNNKGGSSNLPAVVKHFNEEKWLIDGVVMDAEYDRKNNKLIVVAGSELRKYDFPTKTVTKVTLNMPGACVSVSQDGNFAVVGHNALLSYVNLSTMTLVKTVSVSADVTDVVLAPNNYAYAFPKAGQWETIRCVDLVAAKETQNTGSSIYHGTKAKLHPSGKYLYGADNGLSPSDIEKYDISRGTAVYMYDSPYHGDYAMSGDLWLSEDGSRIFTRSGNVFSATADQTTDMVYAGALQGASGVLALDHSTAAGKVYAMLKDATTYAATVGVYDGTYYTLQRTFELPKFITPDGAGGGTIHDGQGHYGFFNSTGTMYYAVTRNKDNAQAFALVSVEVQ